MSETGGKSVFHRRPASPSKPVLASPVRHHVTMAPASSKALDPGIIWAVAGAGGFLVAWVALGAAIAFLLLFTAGLGWLVWQRQRARPASTSQSTTTPARKIGWALVVLLALVSMFFFWNSARLSANLESPEARKLAAISTDPLLIRYAPETAAAGLNTLRSMRQASELSLWLSLGAGGLAILGTIVMVATSRSQQRG